MKHNKFYKFLRIVFLTLAIISMVFALFRKITHAASSSSGYRSTMPLYVSPALGANQGKPSDIDLSGMPNSLLTYLINDGFWSPSVKYVTYEGRDENNTDIIYVNAFSNNATINLSNYPSLNLNSFDSSSTMQFSFSNGVYPMWYNISTGACGMHTHNNTPFILQNYLSIYYDGATPFYALIPNQFIPGYPLYIENDIFVNDNLIFEVNTVTPDVNSGGITISGHSTGGGSLDFDGFTYDSNGNLTGITGGIDLDLNVDLDTSGIEDKLNDLIEGQTEISSEIIYQGNSIGGKIDGLATAQGQTNSKLEDIKGKLEDIKGKLDLIRGKISDIFDKIDDFFEWFTNPFDQDEFDDDLDDLPMFELVDDVKDNMQTNVACFNTQTVTDPVFTFDISGPVLGENQTLTLDLTSYDDYKNLIVPLITMILTVTFVFSLFNDLPNLFHGKSGQDNVN